MSDDRKLKIQPPAVSSGTLPRGLRVVLTSPGKLGALLVGVGLGVSGVPGVTVWIGVVLMALALARALALWARSAPDAASLASEDPDFIRTKAEVRKLRVLEGAESQGNALYDQLEQARLIKKQFEVVLIRRLNPGEVTFGRFEAPFAALYLSVLNRISSLGVDLRTWATVRDPQSKQALEANWKTAFQATTEAVAEMERLVVALGGMQTGQGTSAHEMGEALDHLKAIASRIERFSKPN